MADFRSSVNALLPAIHDLQDPFDSLIQHMFRPHRFMWEDALPMLNIRPHVSRLVCVATGIE